MIENWIFSFGLSLAYALYAGVLFAETGLLIGMFLPGDSFLFSIGLLASQRSELSYPLLMVIGMAAAIAGDSAGYHFGRIVGPRIFKEDSRSRWLKKENIDKTNAFYEKYGVMTIVLARFTPFARTLAPIMAGVGKMPYRTFFTYNVIGGIVWVGLVLSLGFFAGTYIPNIEHYILPVIALIIVASILPGLISALKQRNQH